MNAALVELLLHPRRVSSLRLMDWDRLIPQARNSLLLATLHARIEEAGALEQVPPEVRRHLQSAMYAHTKQRDGLHYELRWLRHALAEVDAPLILLKGAAYACAGLRAGQGRMMSDIDLLVPADRINDAEAALLHHGWIAAELDSYDERYYRQWMHEIPPLGHPRRGSTLDVHHTIIPPTARRRVDAGKLFAATVEVAPGIRVLGPPDMVIHSATHLFHEGEFSHGLRDLWDLHQLMGEFAARDPGFWSALIQRAAELDLVAPLHYGMRYAQRRFGTAIPTTVLEAGARSRRSAVPLAGMDFLFDRAFVPEHPDCMPAGTAFARQCLYVRSHYLRMPMHLLLPHLARKAWMGIGPRQNPDESPDEKNVGQ